VNGTAVFASRVRAHGRRRDSDVPGEAQAPKRITDVNSPDRGSSRTAFS